MGTIAARKLRTVLRNVQAVLAIELLVAVQAVEWRVAMDIDPRTAHPAPEANSDGAKWREAEEEARRFRERTAPERRDAIAANLGEGTRRLYRKVRDLAPPLLGDDRTLDGDIRAVRRAVERNGLM